MKYLIVSIQQFLPERGWDEKAFIGIHSVYAAWYKWPVYDYEGGPDTAAGCGRCSLEAKINATRDPRLTDLCVEYLNGWYQYGSWNFLEDMRQEILIDTTTMFNATSTTIT